jgi:MFS transporter, MHS family, alpha-ketoglutarate permease
MKNVYSPGQSEAATRIDQIQGVSAGRSTALRSLVMCSIGNAMEWFDWTCYAIFAGYLARNLFDSGMGQSALLNTLAVFAVGFIARPIGGILFGRLADIRGRRYVMVATTVMMAVGSAVVGLIPSYSHLGVLSPTILVVARLMQGLAHGGEGATSYPYICEIAPVRSRGLWSSAVFGAVSVGALVATGLGALLTHLLSNEQMLTWGWRVPFLCGSVLGVYACFMRRGLVESSVFQENKNAPEVRRGSQMKHGGRGFSGAVLLRLITLSAGASVTYYTWSAFATAYATTAKGMTSGDAFVASLGAQLVGLVALPVCGALSDRFGRRILCIAFSAGFIVLSFPLEWMLSSHPWTLFVSQSIALSLWAMLTSIHPAVMTEQLPTGVRATAIGGINSFSVAVFGGTAPFLGAFLSSRGVHFIFVLYVMALCLAALVVSWYMPETKGIALDEV